jgi:hypothetical protein
LGFTANSIGNWFITSFAKPLYDKRNGSFRVEAALIAVKYLVFADLAGSRLMLNNRRAVLCFDIRECMGATSVPEQQRIALRKVARL